MPLYEMTCDDCHKSYDLFLTMEQMADHLGKVSIVTCPDCNTMLRREYGGIRIVGDTCAGNRSCEGIHPDLGYVRSRTHMEQVAREKGMVPIERDDSLDEIKYIQKHGRKDDRETNAELKMAGKAAGRKRREAQAREAMKDLPEITRDDLEKTKAKLANQPKE